MKERKSLKIASSFINGIDKISSIFDGLKNVTKTIDSAIKHLKGFRNDISDIWNIVDAVKSKKEINNINVKE